LRKKVDLKNNDNKRAKPILGIAGQNEKTYFVGFSTKLTLNFKDYNKIIITKVNQNLELGNFFYFPTIVKSFIFQVRFHPLK